MTAKKIYWYRIRRVPEDLAIKKFRIVKETATRLYLHKESQTGFDQTTVFFNKVSSYEAYFSTREVAVTAKIRLLKKNLKNATENTVQARNLLKEFREQENG